MTTATSAGARSTPGPNGGPGLSRFRGRLARIVVAVIAGVTLAAAAAVVLAVSSSSAVIPPGSTVAVIGDSYSTGTVLGGQGASNWTARVGLDREWEITDTAIGGTGYTQAHDTDGPYAAAQLDQALVHTPALVIVQGSINDGQARPGQVGGEARALYAAIRQRDPAARVVVVGPAWPNAQPPAEILRIRDELAAAAATSDATWIDPVAERWFAAPEGLIGSDDVHPTDAGHAVMAGRIGADLHAAGL